MHTRYVFANLISGLGLMLFFLAPAYTEAKTLPSSRQAYSLDSGIHNGVIDGFNIAFQQIVRVDGTRWLRLHFGNYHLGKKSYITITSLKDGAIQHFNEQSLSDYNNSSAYFNGDSVEVKLYVAHGETGIYFRLEEITAGDWRIDTNSKDAVNTSDFTGICGTDDRVSAYDPRVGRILIDDTVHSKGTAFIISNSALLSAGHTELTGTDLIEFNVPSSNCSGGLRFAEPQDQYQVDKPFGGDYPVEADGGNGDDYIVFQCRPNSETGLLPFQAQGAFYRLSLDEAPATVRVTGYGADEDPPGCYAPTWNYNADNATLQTHSGNFSGEFTDGPIRVYIQYDVDTAGGNSGSPVIVESNGVVIGIHTTGGCPNHKGTSFKNNALKQAIQEFEGQNVIYVDKGHPVVLEDGSVFRPYKTVGEGIAGAISGGTVSIIKGTYDESMVVSKSLTLSAPVGNVIIGE